MLYNKSKFIARCIQLSTLIVFKNIVFPSVCFSASFYSSTKMSNILKKIPHDKLFVSEPNPAWFGNGPNPKGHPDWTNSNWLKSRFHFSFAEYSNEDNSNFGVLRVLNDDLVQPDRMFGEHPHRDVEICTYVVEGSLTHQDSMGTKETLTRGAIQFMTAGKGVRHSEGNGDPSKPLRFLQLWINTRQRGLPANYGSFVGDLDARRNKWSHLVSDELASFDTPIKINQDANIYATELDPSPSSEPTSVTYSLGDKRQVYLVCVEGKSSVTVNTANSDSKSVDLERHDAAEIIGPATITVTVKNSSSSAGESSESKSEHESGSHLLMVEMAKQGYGRSDL